MSKPDKPQLPMCLRCNLMHDPGTPGVSCLKAQREAMETLLKRVAGFAAQCKGCDAPIFWITHKNGKKCPYTASGLPHWSDCPAAKEFKR